MSVTSTPVRAGCPAYGRAALLLGALLCWYAVWTVACNLLVLAGVRYAVLLWLPLLPTAVTAAAIARYGRAVAARYAAVAMWPAAQPAGGRLAIGTAAALVLALATAQLAQQFGNVAAIVLGASAAAAVLYVAASGAPDASPAAPRFGWRPPTLAALLYAIYLFGNRPDGDDANFVNLAVGAKRTHGLVYQFDTMIGDGPNPIHLPTYRFHSFELLGAVLSSYTGLEPVQVFHLVLPLLLIPFLAAIMVAVLAPAAGPRWFPAALIWLAFLFFNLDSLGGWGLHGVIRLFQGKGFYVTGLLPLIAMLTVRWFRRGERIDLVGLGLANACAVGFTANGIYGGPTASAFAGLALALARPRDPVGWRRLAALAPTIAWPAAAVVMTLLLHLGHPSEVLVVQTAAHELNFDTWYGLAGRLTLALALVGGVGLLGVGLGRRAPLLYVPLALGLAMNPLAWPVVVGITGNLGFRIFWSLPVPALVGLEGVALLAMAGLRSERAQIVAGAALLVAGGAYASIERVPYQKITWRAPALRVDPADWATVGGVARAVAPGCPILLPERYSTLLSMMEGAARPVAVRALYMLHYRFSLPDPERRLRADLLLVADGKDVVADTGADAVRRNRVAIGAIAVAAAAPTAPRLAALARALDLPERAPVGPLRLWAGGCYRGIAAGAAAPAPRPRAALSPG